MVLRWIRTLIVVCWILIQMLRITQRSYKFKDKTPFPSLSFPSLPFLSNFLLPSPPLINHAFPPYLSLYTPPLSIPIPSTPLPFPPLYLFFLKLSLNLKAV